MSYSSESDQEIDVETESPKRAKVRETKFMWVVKVMQKKYEWFYRFSKFRSGLKYSYWYVQDCKWLDAQITFMKSKCSVPILIIVYV